MESISMFTINHYNNLDKNKNFLSIEQIILGFSLSPIKSQLVLFRNYL